MPIDQLLDKYSWAIPDQRALNILAAFAPIVEVGAGKGYWARLLRDQGVDVIAIDQRIHKNAWTTITKAGPETLSNLSSRSLFLCYPDDFQDSQESMALKCLEVYQGNVVIVVGELLGSTRLENPWGKSIAPEAQLELSAKFHRVIEAPLPSFPVSADSISVWKRTVLCEVDDMIFSHIPSEEMLPCERACPAFAHLLQQ